MKRAIFLAALVLATPLSARAVEEDGVEVDIPVVLKEARIVFNLDHAAFTGAEPTGLFFPRLMLERFRQDRTSASLVVVFHGANAAMTLDDAAYDRAQNWTGGNPYKAQLLAFIREDVSVEECAESMRLHHWSHADLIPGVKVNSGANFRVVSLVQQGYVQIQP